MGMALLHILEDISDALDECRRHSNTNSIEVIDRVLFRLDYCDEIICRWVSVHGATDHLDILRELLQCINQLQVHWFVQLNRIEGGTGIVAGRPKKVVNVELVCLHVVFLKVTMHCCTFSEPLSTAPTCILAF